MCFSDPHFFRVSVSMFNDFSLIPGLLYLPRFRKAS